MTNELKQHIKFCYKETLNTYKWIKPLERIKNKAYEQIKQHLEYEIKIWNLTWNFTDQELFNFINKL